MTREEAMRKKRDEREKIRKAGSGAAIADSLLGGKKRNEKENEYADLGKSLDLDKKIDWLCG